MWLCAVRGLLCWVVWASLSYCSTQPSSAGTSSFYEMLRLWLRPSNLGWLSADHHCCLHGRLLISCWWFSLRLELLHRCHRWVKGVSPIEVLVVIVYAHKILGNSSSQAPFASSNKALMILSIVQFVTSTWPLAWGWPGDENWFLIASLEQKSLKP